MFNHIIKLYELENIEDRILTIDSVTYNDELCIEIKLIKLDEICPYCSSTLYKIKDYQKKKITHTFSNTRKTFIIYYRRRYLCKICNKTFFENDPFTSTNNNISTLTVMNILNYLKDYNHTFSSAAKVYNVSVQSIINIFDKHVDPKPRPLPRVLSIDEVHIKSNIKHPYACVLLDFETNKIVDILQTRKKYKLRDYFEHKSIKELDNVEYVTMDLWAPYRDIVQELMPKALIVADSFHVVTLINRILDTKRRQVMNRYLRSINIDLNYSNDFGYLLKKYSVLLRLSPNKLKEKLVYIPKYQMNVYTSKLLKHLLTSDSELNEIYNLRNIYLEFNTNSNYQTAKTKLESMITLFTNHKIPEIREYGRTLKRWKSEILNSFIKHGNSRYSNGRIEGKNRDIKTIIRNGYGLKNFRRFRARVLYSVNKNIEIKISNK